MRVGRHTETTMGAAFVAAGLRPEDVEFDRAIALYLNTGGTIERARARLDVAAERLPGGRTTDASDGLGYFASRQPNLPQGHQKGAIAGPRNIAERESELLDEGHQSIADTGLVSGASIQQPEAGGEGHPSQADEATDPSPIPAREQSAEQIAALTKARQHAAKSIFDRVLTITGRAWGNINYRELREYAHDGEFAKALMNHIGSKRGDEAHKQIRELINPRAFAMLANRHAMIQQ